MNYTVEHCTAGLGVLLEEWIREGHCGWLLIHHPQCPANADDGEDDDCECTMSWIGPFGQGFAA